MPTYSYFCNQCNKGFELFAYIKNYDPNPKCIVCSSIKTHRLYTKDVLTQSSSIKKSDSELKTLGDLALRNTERMSDDEKASLYAKHNAYKNNEPERELPSGMQRLKKIPKTIWPGTNGKRKRRDIKK